MKNLLIACFALSTLIASASIAYLIFIYIPDTRAENEANAINSKFQKDLKDANEFCVKEIQVKLDWASDSISEGISLGADRSTGAPRETYNKIVALRDYLLTPAPQRDCTERKLREWGVVPR